MKIDISIVIPVFRSHECLEKLFFEISQSLNEITNNWEIILVDDGSNDAKTFKKMLELRENDNRIKLIRFSKNRGQHHATLCGIKYSSGKYVVTLDDDLQNPPNEIKRFINTLDEGFQLVIGKIADGKKHNFFRNLASASIQILISRILGKPKYLTLSSFRGMTNQVAKRISGYQGAHPYIPALMLEAASPEETCNIEVLHSPRYRGQSNYTSRKLFKLASYLLINHSNIPLRIVALWGFTVSIGSFIYALYIAIEAAIYGSSVSGWPSLAVLISFLSGNILLSIGVLGEYIGRLTEEVSHSRQFPICEEHLE